MSHILVIGASQQKTSESRRIAEYIQKQLQAADTSTDILDLGQTVLPFWNGEDATDTAQMNGIRQQLQQATAFVFVIPEWNGMAPPAIRNLMIWFGASEFAHKPALLCAISAGQGGAFVISEMRSSNYKNQRLLYTPEHLIIRDVCNMLKSDQPEGESDSYYRERIDFALQELLAYDSALTPIRPAAIERMTGQFGNGMS